MGRLAKQKMAEKRSKIITPPPPLPKPSTRKNKPNKESKKGTKEPMKPAPWEWEGLTIADLRTEIQTNYLPMLRSRLLLEYGDFIAETSTLKQPSQRQWDTTVSDKVNWKSFLLAIEREKKQRDLQSWDNIFLGPKKARRLERPFPASGSCLLASKTPECGGFPDEFVESEIRHFVMRTEGADQLGLNSLAADGFWDTLGLQLFRDELCITFALDGMERKEMMEAFRKVCRLYFVRIWQEGSELNPDVFYDLTEHSKQLDAKRLKKKKWLSTPIF